MAPAADTTEMTNKNNKQVRLCRPNIFLTPFHKNEKTDSGSSRNTCLEQSSSLPEGIITSYENRIWFEQEPIFQGTSPRRGHASKFPTTQT